VNTDAPSPDLDEAEQRVLEIQTKLHQWAADDPHRRFSDLYNVVCDTAVLLVAWARVRGNRGARWTGDIIFGTETLLPMLRADLKARQFAPLCERSSSPSPWASFGGSASPAPGIAPCKPRARPQDPPPPARHRGGDDGEGLERARRVDRHQAAGDAPDGLRVQKNPST